MNESVRLPTNGIRRKKYLKRGTFSLATKDKSPYPLAGVVRATDDGLENVSVGQLSTLVGIGTHKRRSLQVPARSKPGEPTLSRTLSAHLFKTR